MLKDEILEKIFSNKEMQKIPIGCQSTAVSVFEDVLEELRKESFISINFQNQSKNQSNKCSVSENCRILVGLSVFFYAKI